MDPCMPHSIFFSDCGMKLHVHQTSRLELSCRKWSADGRWDAAARQFASIFNITYHSIGCLARTSTGPGAATEQLVSCDSRARMFLKGLSTCGVAL
eukprot:837461-Pelagomonas_calceolata.AAC.1